MTTYGWGLIGSLARTRGPVRTDVVTNWDAALALYKGHMYLTDPATRILIDASRARELAQEHQRKSGLRDRFGYVHTLEDSHSRAASWSHGDVEVQGHWNRELQSRASSASSYQQHGGALGTSTPSRRFKNIDAIPPGSRVMKPSWKTSARHPHGGVKKGHHYCKKGWLLVRVGDTNMCWKPPR